MRSGECRPVAAETIPRCHAPQARNDAERRMSLSRSNFAGFYAFVLTAGDDALAGEMTG